MISFPSVLAGSLAVVLFLLSVALFPRGWWKRERKYLAVVWAQMPEADRAVWRWMGRTAWVTLLVVAAML